MKTRFFLIISLFIAFVANSSAQTVSFEWSCRGGMQVTFTNRSSHWKEITAIDWDFGDGQHDTGTTYHTAFHKYETHGIYIVKLTVTYDTVVLTYTDSINFYCPKGTLEYQYSFSGCVPFQVMVFPNISLADTAIYKSGGGQILHRIGMQLGSPISFTYLYSGAYLPSIEMIKWTENPETGEIERCVVEWQSTDTFWAIDLQPDFIVNEVYFLDSLVEFERTTSVEPFLLPDSIHWDYGNGDSLWIYNTETELLNGQTTYSAEGTYTVTLTEYCKGCSQSKSYDIEVRGDVGIKELQVTGYKLRVYPNPINGELRIEHGGLEIEHGIIYDIYGRVIDNFQFSSFHSSLTIDISHLAKGMYFLKVDTKVVKFVKE